MIMPKVSDDEDDVVPVHVVVAVDPSAVDYRVEAGGTVTLQNWDEIETESVAVGMVREEAETFGLEVIEPRSPMWTPRFDHIEEGEEITLDGEGTT